MSLPHFDAKLAVLVLVFAAVFTLAQSVAGLVRVGVARRAVNRRLQVAERGGSIGELVLELRKQRGLGEDGKARGGFLADLVLRSGVPYEPRKWALYVGLVAMAGFLLAFLVSHNALVALVGAAALGAGGPLLYLIGTILFKHAIRGIYQLSHLVGIGLFIVLIPFAERFTPLSLAVAAAAILMIVAAWEAISLGSGSRQSDDATSA